MGNTQENSPYRYRTFVRIIGVLDIIFSLFLLGFYLLRLAFYEGNDGDMTTGIFYKYGIIKDTDLPFYYFIDEMQKYYMIIWISIFFIHTVQLVMGIILLFGACQNGVPESQRRCKTWCSSLPFQYFCLGIELFIVGQTCAKFGLRYQLIGVWTTKLIFRLLAEKVVRAHLTEFSNNQVYSYGARNSYPFY